LEPRAQGRHFASNLRPDLVASACKARGAALEGVEQSAAMLSAYHVAGSLSME
jgi:hypothetical protein